jgi:hypothetical protein
MYQLSQLDNLAVQFPVLSLGSGFLESGVTNVRRRRNFFSFRGRVSGNSSSGYGQDDRSSVPLEAGILLFSTFTKSLQSVVVSYRYRDHFPQRG